MKVGDVRTKAPVVRRADAVPVPLLFMAETVTCIRVFKLRPNVPVIICIGMVHCLAPKMARFEPLQFIGSVSQVPFAL
jgi:hypothetical protein